MRLFFFGYSPSKISMPFQVGLEIAAAVLAASAAVAVA